MIALIALALATVQPADFLREEETELLQFEYGWPAAAEALPSLRELLRTDMETAHAEAVGYAEEERRFAAENGFDYVRQYYAKGWQVSGRAPGLLSLSASNETYTGGAHGNVGFSAILWDVAADAPVEAATLLGADALARLTPRYCEALDAERAEVRGEPVRPNPEDSFTLCPPLAEQVLVPTDGGGNGRFDTLAVLIPPYIAGPYAEGTYSVNLAFGEEDLAGIAEGYRPAFEMGHSARAEPRE